MHNLNVRIIVMIVIALLAIIGLVVTSLVARRVRAQALQRKFERQWLAVQRQCAKSETWPTAVIDADKLIDDVLRAMNFKGKGMGERLVSAQRTLTDNDALWFAHKLCGRIANDEMNRLYKKDVQAALRGYRRALQDLGVL